MRRGQEPVGGQTRPQTSAPSPTPDSRQITQGGKKEGESPERPLSRLQRDVELSLQTGPVSLGQPRALVVLFPAA